MTVMFFRKFLFFLFVVYICFTCYSGYLLLTKSEKTQRITPEFTFDDEQQNNRKNRHDDSWNPWGEDFEPEQAAAGYHHRNIHRSPPLGNEHRPSPVKYTIEIWGKAAIGAYLWEHIMASRIETRAGGLWQSGTKIVGNLRFEYKSGPGLSPETAPSDVEYLILVLNGRDKEKISFARSWLDYLSNYPRLQHTFVVLLGDEQCRNSWILSYMKTRGGKIDAVFVVYDTNLVDDNEFYQWPLGVATYRGFNTVDSHKIDIESSRPYKCNFLGTVYPKSSRKTLLMILQRKEYGKICFIKPRDEWLPGETVDSLKMYQYALSLSDLTLNPVGMNTECYRIYESVAFGSVPVIEDKLTPGNCQNPPLKLLKNYKAPFIFINDWSIELPRVLAEEAAMSLKEKIERRIILLEWYESFKLSMRNKLIGVIKSKCAFTE